MNTRRFSLKGALATIGLIAAAAALQSSGCADALTDEDFYATYELKVTPSQSGEPTSREQLIEDIDGARDTVHAALYTLEDDGVANALVRAHERGVDVRVASDADNAESSGFQTLSDADMAPSFGDGELDYLPDFFLASVLGACELREAEQTKVCTRSQGGGQGSMLRPGSFNRMTNNYVVIDQVVTWNFAMPLDGRDEHPLAWRTTGSDISRDFAREAQQLYGGTYATTLDTFSGMLKSRQDFRVEYSTSDGPVEVRFNPQERLIKEVIDEVYAARASVYIMTDNLVNSFLLEALEYKQQAGFDVKLIINGAQQAAGESRQRLDALGAVYVDRALPTMMLIDTADDRNGNEWPRKAVVLSHELVRGSPYDVERREPNDIVKIYPADQFFDGNMWALTEHGSRVHERKNIDRLLDFWRSIENG